MGGKKKGKSGKGKKGAEEEDLSTETLQRVYRKKCTENGVRPCRQMNEYFENYYDEGEHIKKVHIHEELGPKGTQALMEALTATKWEIWITKKLSYKHITSLRLWECGIGDEGVAHLCQFLSVNKSVETLDLLKNKITETGCGFLGKVLGLGAEAPIKVLHLDHNPIGSSGVDKLANGLAQNKVITVLSIAHAELDAKCAQSIRNILIYIESKLKELELPGNCLKSQGVAEILPAAKIAKSLTVLDVSDNQVEDSQTLFERLEDLALNTRTVRRINLGNNFLTNDFISQSLKPLEEGKKITDINFGIKIDPQLRLKLKATLLENKKIAKKAKKKKKKKGKKGKSKKKK